MQIFNFSFAFKRFLFVPSSSHSQLMNVRGKNRKTRSSLRRNADEPMKKRSCTTNLGILRMKAVEVFECKWQSRNFLFPSRTYPFHLLCGSHKLLLRLFFLPSFAESWKKISMFALRNAFKDVFFPLKCRLSPTLFNRAATMCVAFANIWAYW